MEELKTSETLNKAADLIEERGWTKGPTGWAFKDQPLCLEGGILAAMGMNMGKMVTSLGGTESFRACPAYSAVRDYLKETRNYKGRTIYLYNDMLASGKEEIIEILRAAALIEEVKEEALENFESELDTLVEV
jgi:hypothetical protein